MRAPFIALSIIWACAGQTPSDLEVDKALDAEISKVADLPEAAQERAVVDLARRVRQRPGRNSVALASNLAVSAGEANPLSQGTLQDVASTLAGALLQFPEKGNPGYQQLASLVRYDHAQVTLENPEYTAAMARLEATERLRDAADFTLSDVQGIRWTLKSLRGKVVIVNFWATWCPPCRKELPALAELYRRFRSNGLVILGVTDEEPAKMKAALAVLRVPYPVLPDARGKVSARFGVTGVPVCLIYGRDGHLAATVNALPTVERFTETLRLAGLR